MVLRNRMCLFHLLLLSGSSSPYTRESGVRTLEKNVAKVIRNRARLRASDLPFAKKLSLQDIDEIMGIPQFSPR